MNHLRRCLELAQSRRGFCSPNPAVGACVVCEEKILSEGFHNGPGTDHAEVVALTSLERIPENAVLFLSLEPCCHWGRTPPCTELIIEKGVRHVIYGFQDPDFRVAGKGHSRLREAGVRCEYIEIPEIQHFYRSYKHWVSFGRPWVTFKLAMSWDGKVAGPCHEPIHITGIEAKNYTHERRFHADAILTTSQTILSDDPEFNVRLFEMAPLPKPLYILDSFLKISDSARVFSSTGPVTLLHGPHAEKARVKRFQKNGVRILELSALGNGLDLVKALALIGADGVHDLWVEAGPTLYKALSEERLVNQALFYFGPQWLGMDAYSAALPQVPMGHTRWFGLGNTGACEVDF